MAGTRTPKSRYCVCYTSEQMHLPIVWDWTETYKEANKLLGEYMCSPSVGHHDWHILTAKELDAAWELDELNRVERGRQILRDRGLIK